MPNIPQISTPLTSNKNYSFTNRQYDGNIEPFDMVELANPIKAAGAQGDGGSSSSTTMMMGRKSLAPLTVQIKDPTMAVETLKNLLNNDLLEQTMVSGYTELYGDMEELINSFYLRPDQLVEEIRNQEKQNTMFSGDDFYKILHDILKTTTGTEMKEGIGNLLKAMNFSSNKQEILDALSANMKFLSEYFSPNAGLSYKLKDLSQRWGDSNASDAFEQLKGETLSLLKDVSASLLNDERTQTFIPLVVHNMSRYNTNAAYLKESFANLLSMIPSNETRRELSIAFNALLKKMFSKAEISEMNNSTTYNNTLNEKENQELLSIFDNKDEKMSFSLFIKSYLSKEENVEQLDINEEKLRFITSGFFEGKAKGLQTLKNVLMTLVPGTSGRQGITLMHKDFQTLSDLTRVVDYLNDILKEMPDIPQRDELFSVLTEIVNKMAERKELPSTSNIPSAPSTLDKLTDFIGKNINHEAIQSLDNFNASNLLQSLLNAPGVFTPLAHYILPLQVDDDTRAFGELWVDNDENNPNNTPVGQKNYHLFLTFDVEAVGRFELDMYALGENINMSLLYPEGFTPKVKKLTDKIENVVHQIGYKPVKFDTAVLRKPHVLTDVFPKITERRARLNAQA